eukprot:m.356054 g.356054  ORF g.356054 m.356054 type:complete len:65 (+) comp17426_c0_seq1:1424-1618(+)
MKRFSAKKLAMGTRRAGTMHSEQCVVTNEGVMNYIIARSEGLMVVSSIARQLYTLVHKGSLCIF